MITLLLKLCRAQLRWWWWVPIILFDAVFVIVFCAVTYINFHGNNLWAAYRADAEKRGVELDLAKFIPPPVPDEENYAAIPLFQQAFSPEYRGRAKDLFGFPSVPKGRPKESGLQRELRRLEKDGAVRITGTFPAPKAPKQPGSRLEAIRDAFIAHKWIAADQKDLPPAEAVLAGLARFTPQLEQLHEAAGRPKCRFQTDWTLALTADMPHLSVLSSAGRAWEARIRANLEVGATDAAFDDVLDLLAANRAAGMEPTAIAALLKVALFCIANEVIAEGIYGHRWTETQLAAFERELAKSDFVADCPRWISGERAGMNQTMEWVFGDYRPAGVAPPDQDTGNGFGPKGLRRVTGWGRWNQTYVNWCMDEYLARLDVQRHRWLGDFEVKHGPEKLRTTTEGRLMIFAAFMLPVYPSIIQRMFYTHTQHQMLRAAIAIERHRLAHGAAPEALGQLVPAFLTEIPRDVFDGTPLHYRANTDGTFLLYGNGLNRTDDGGTAGDDESEWKAADWIWPSGSR